MDRSPVKDALEKSRLIISSHGMVNYMPDYAKNSLMNPINEASSGLTFDFCLYPKKSIYDSNNCNCSLVVNYSSSGDIERDNGIYRDYICSVFVRMSSSELTLQMLKKRENMIELLFMLIEMIESIIPKKLTLTVTTPEQLKENKKIHHEQIISEQIFSIAGKNSILNLRKGGKSKTTLLSQKYAEVYGSMPAPGKYRFKHIKNVNRKGKITDQADIVFVVQSPDDRTIIKAYRVA